MNNSSNAIKTVLLDIINFCLNTVKNSQFINFIIATILYISIFLIILLGFSFNYQAEQASAFIVDLAKYLPNSNYTYNIDASLYIKYYLLILFILAFMQECILKLIFKISKKDFRDVVRTNKTILFFGIITFILVIEIAVAIILKEYWLSLVGLLSFSSVVFFYFLNKYISNFISKIQNYLKVLY